MSTIVFTVDEEIRKQIDMLQRITGKPEKTLMREVVKTGLRSYPVLPAKSINALLELATWAEKNNVTGPADLSQNLDAYLWG
jgi:hypothetical protein